MNITNAGVRGYNPTGVVIHNDAGSNGANTSFYNNWLPAHDPTNGFAHVYIASDGRLQALTSLIWHGIVLTHTVTQIMLVGKCANQREI